MNGTRRRRVEGIGVLVKSRKTAVAAAVLTFGALVVQTTPASADTKWINAPETYMSKSVVLDPVGFWTDGDGKPCRVVATGGVQKAGDYVWIADQCADGKSAVAWISWKKGGEVYHRYCRNKLGAKSVGRCNLDWPEDATKTLYIGVSNGNTNSGSINDFNYGLGKHFRG